MWCSWMVWTCWRAGLPGRCRGRGCGSTCSPFRFQDLAGKFVPSRDEPLPLFSSYVRGVRLRPHRGGTKGRTFSPGFVPSPGRTRDERDEPCWMPGSLELPAGHENRVSTRFDLYQIPLFDQLRDHVPDPLPLPRDTVLDLVLRHAFPFPCDVLGDEFEDVFSEGGVGELFRFCGGCDAGFDVPSGGVEVEVSGCVFVESDAEGVGASDVPWPVFGDVEACLP